ncbi:MAG: FG-GAP repeat domain-containing protein [Deltaproteobacteria bacterium]
MILPLALLLAVAPPRLLVLDVTARGGVTPEVAAAVSEALVVEARRRAPQSSVLGAQEMRALTGFAKEKQRLGCEDMACLVELGGALGADRLVLGTLGRLGGTYLLSLELVDVPHARVIGSGSATVSAGKDDVLFGAVATAAAQLFGAAPPPAERPAVAVAPTPAASVRCPIGRLFGDEQAYAVGGMPTGLGSGDFDGDGNLDLAVASFRDGQVALLLGRGKGYFRPARHFPLPKGASPEALAVADLDGDGHPDVALVTAEQDRIDVLYGDGKGGFSAPVSYPVGGAEYLMPRGLAVGDFDGDGRLDLATVDGNGQSGSASVLYGLGRRRFSPGVKVVAVPDAHVYALAAGDVDGDGRSDLVVLADPGVAAVLRGRKDRSFEAPIDVPAGRRPRAALLLDLDGDGKLDLAIANAGDDTVSVAAGFGDGSFAPPRGFSTKVGGVGTGPVALAAADFDGDGRLDLAVGNGGVLSADPDGRPTAFDHTVSVLLARPEGGYAPARLLTVGGAQPAYLAAGHLQGPTGPADLAVSFFGPYNVDGPPSVSVFLAGCR